MDRRTDWNHFDYVYGEGRQARVEFDVQSAVLPTDDSLHGVRFVVPTAAESELAAVLETVAGLWVGRLVYAERCEYLVQVGGDADIPTEAVEALGGTVEHTQGWDYFNDRVCPQPADWRRIQDREALERLDLDGDGEFRILHRFYGDPPGLARVKGRLGIEGFETVGESDDRLTLAHSHPIADISRITVGLLRLCERAGVAYDGWVLPG